MTNSKNNRTALVLAGVAVGMVGMAYAAVPLYQIFCQITGYGGTTQVAQAAERPILERVIKVRFSANTHRDMPWNFRPLQGMQRARVGEQMLAFFEATNTTAHVITGTATFNVTPHKAGAYFSKIQCFCFTEQTLAPGERADMPVTYFIDPAIMDDPGLDDVKEIVLSYTFFRSGKEGETGESKNHAMVAENLIK
ncbi:MAG: cytochrome c oxidase assembly protein [Proteobacteria bacterium]|nr:cytochrome c oxidase assembly protein [Pseudomonadota bacterium]